MLRCTEDPPDALRRRARLLADELGLRRLPRVTNERIVPMLVALPIPTIVLSRPLIESLRDEEVDALLLQIQGGNEAPPPAENQR